MKDHRGCIKSAASCLDVHLFTRPLLNIFRTQSIQPSNHHLEFIIVDLGEGFNTEGGLIFCLKEIIKT